MIDQELWHEIVRTCMADETLAPFTSDQLHAAMSRAIQLGEAMVAGRIGFEQGYRVGRGLSR